MPLAPPSTNEHENLCNYLSHQRGDLNYVAFELTDEQARQTPTAGDLSIAWLYGHLAMVEQGWIDYATGEVDVLSGDGYELPATATLSQLKADLAETGKRTTAALAKVDLDRPVAVPADLKPFFPEVEWSVRWVIGHLIQEYARHLGHADIIRESIDGRTMYELKAMAQGWYDAYKAMNES